MIKSAHHAGQAMVPFDKRVMKTRMPIVPALVIVRVHQQMGWRSFFKLLGQAFVRIFQGARWRQAISLKLLTLESREFGVQCAQRWRVLSQHADSE